MDIGIRCNTLVLFSFAGGAAAGLLAVQALQQFPGSRAISMLQSALGVPARR
jgi:hypothetical protein